MPGQAQTERVEHDLVIMGQVLAPFGLKGWVKIRPYTESIGTLLEYSPWWIQDLDRPGQWRETTPTEGHEHGTSLLARLEGMSDRDQALRVKGAKIAVGRNDLPKPKKGEFYWVDLIGMSVLNLQGVSLGLVAAITGTGAHELMRVEGDRERFIPFVEVYICAVDLDAKVIRVDWQADY